MSAVLLAGCAPAMDWREMRPDGAALHATFPCRPDRQVRTVPVAGEPVQLTLHVCQAQGVTMAVGYLDVSGPAKVDEALRDLLTAARRNLGASAAEAGPGEWRVAGMTPQPASGRWRLSGRLPDGRAIHAEIAVFSRGTRVVQATWMSDRPDDGTVRTFFDGLKFLE